MTHPLDSPAGRCRGCGAPILWARCEETDRVRRFDTRAVLGGAWLLAQSEPGDAHLIASVQLNAIRGHRIHTCNQRRRR